MPRTRHLVTAVCLGVGLLARAALAQSAAEAEKLFDAEQWAPAAAAYAKIVASEPKNADAWFHLGVAQRSLKQYDQAIVSLQRALDSGFPSTRGLAALGFAKALAGDTSGAFAALDAAVEAGLPVQVLDTHPAMASLKSDPRFAALRRKADAKSHPCAADARHRVFDFWVGDWDVFSGTQQVGHNRIERLLDGCLLMENWTGAYGSSGKSVNYFDPASGKWKQNWVDENGGIVWYEGEVKDGVMHFSGENIAPDGKRKLARVELAPQPDGTVHHKIETSADGGKTWTVAFDAIYRPAARNATGLR
jgi:Tetratricopeptide repeat